MSRAGVIAVVAATLAGALVVFVPHMRSRVVSDGTPVPQPLITLMLYPVPAHSAACMDSVAVEPGHQLALVDIRTQRLAPPLLFTVRGQSYSQTYRLPKGSISGPIVFPFQGPRRSQLTTVCIRNLDKGDVALVGTNEPRTLSRPRMTIGGAPADGEFSLAFRSANGESTFKLAGTVADRIAAFKPAFVQPWLVVVLLALVLVGSFAVPLLALWRSFVLDERQ
jgi:hypothetical protein